MFRISVGWWRHKICKYAAEIFQNAKKSAVDLGQILRMITIEVVINTIRVMGAFMLQYPAGMHCPA